MDKRYQTLSQFMAKPFNKPNADKDLKYGAMYRSSDSSRKLKINAVTIVEKSYYIHIKIPSETNKGKQDYDVVIRFFTDDPDIEKEKSLLNYKIQFFSNSPSFIYKYAYVYEQEGFLIEALYNKLDPEFRGKAPEKTNSNLDISYDKSIFFACKFLLDNQFKLLYKNGAINLHKKTITTFFRGISDFQSIKIDQDLINAEKQLSTELDAESKARSQRLRHERKKMPTNSTFDLNSKQEEVKKGIRLIDKKKPKSKIMAKKSVKSTFKKK